MEILGDDRIHLTESGMKVWKDMDGYVKNRSPGPASAGLVIAFLCEEIAHLRRDISILTGRDHDKHDRLKAIEQGGLG